MRESFAGSMGRIGGSRGSLAVLFLAICAFALAVAPAGAAAPTVEIGAVSNVFGTSAHVTGSVDPGDQLTSWSFETSTDGVAWSGFAPQGEIDGSVDPGPHGVEFDLGGLSPSTKYFVRLTATNSIDPEANSSSLEFTTPAVPAPTVLSVGDATNRTNTTAEVSGSVERPTSSEPNDPALNPECFFEYLSDADFGNRSTQQRLSASDVYEIGYGAGAAGPIPADLSASALQAFLEAGLPEVAGAITVTGGPGGPGGGNSYLISFGGSLANKPVGFFVSSFVAEITTLTLGHSEGFEAANQVACDPPVTTPGPNSVTAQLTGLEPNTEYHLRLSATNLSGTDSKVANNFTTTAIPETQTNAASDLGPTSATLRAKINPFGAPVDYQFEWGVKAGANDESYENVAPAAPEPLSFADHSFHVVTSTLTGLSPATAYHYRVVATNTQSGETSAGVDRVFETSSPAVADSCPNETSRIGFSANLPDCRAYEFVSSGLNNASIFNGGTQRVRADGSAILFETDNAPDKAEGSNLFNQVVARRGATGWTTESIVAPTPGPSGFYTSGSQTVVAVSDDLSQRVYWTPQPLVGSASPIGANYYLRRADGSTVALTHTGPGTSLVYQYAGGIRQIQVSKDFAHIFFTPCVKQLPIDPIEGCVNGTPEPTGNIYEWTNGSLRLVAMEPGPPGPGQTPFPNGGSLAGGLLPSTSDDGRLALFVADGLPGLYLRIDGQETVAVSASKRTDQPGPNPPVAADPVGVAADGSQALFTSHAELTDDANTGETEGVPNESGNDLYSFDPESKALVDLTADDNPADSAAGADVRRVLGVNGDASFIYFTANGVLTPGASPGDCRFDPNVGREVGICNLYVKHGDDIEVIGQGTEFQGFYVTPDGHHTAFLTRTSVTGYDNTNPKTGEAEPMLFKYTYGGGFECASCRPDGTPPTATAKIRGRPLSDDGSRAFFQSADAVLPQATNGLDNVYEYESQKVHLLSPGDGEVKTTLLGASASGDDVFLYTHRELAQAGQGPVAAMYDARVDVDVPVLPQGRECQGEGCLGAPSSAASTPSAGSAQFNAITKVSAAKALAVRSPKARVRVLVPSGGQLRVSGNGLETVKKRVTKQGSVTLTLALRPAAEALRQGKGVFKTRANVFFSSSAGDTSRTEISLTFKAIADKRGGK